MIRKKIDLVLILFLVFDLAYIFLIFDSLSVYKGDLYAFYTSLFVNVPVGILLGIFSLLALKIQPDLPKFRRIILLLGMFLGFLYPVISIILFKIARIS
jgi:hypothetical protein